ncbi:two-component regulator propeller domain-containing protein [Mucilaginibacter sp.]|uniref:sensor histidine kinase n=1 Tax=Mucilaginibacter sp. TaxID=1882438 RepID=UPI0025E9D258|nr:two-component regulator propeller domain-containing protein [Mucilaginibacter sp.]
MRISFLLQLFLFTTTVCAAQQQKYSAFTVNDGLPSNYVYRAIEDNKGFLWVATDAGIARFDGKHFQVFTIKDGLPDNEVLAVVKEKNGRIWVNCFKQSPAYFDEVKNKFINAKEDSLLAKVKESTGTMYCFALQNGGVMFNDSKGSFIFKDKKLISYSIARRKDFFIKDNGDGTRLESGTVLSGEKNKFQTAIFLIRGNTVLDSVIIRVNSTMDNVTFGLNDGKFYFLSALIGKCYIYSDFSSSPIRFRIDSVAPPELFVNFEFTDEGFYLLGASGKLYLYNKKTLQMESEVSGNYLPNSMYKDHSGNIWVSTIDKGLVVYKRKQFGSIEMPRGFTHTDFLSVARKPDGTILAGNFYGEVIESHKNIITNHIIAGLSQVNRQRKILLSQGKTFTFSETNVYENYKPIGRFGKTAINYSDSVIIIGQSRTMIKLNTVTGEFTNLNGLKKRVTALTKAVDGAVYFGSTDGLYKYNYSTNIPTVLTENSPLLRERITALCATPDGLVWVATSGSGVVVLKNDRVLFQIDEKKGIVSNVTRSITIGKPGQVWLGTSAGISVINYKLLRNKLPFTIQNLTEHDGLASNVVNEMLYQNDTVYAATGKGIAVIPANVSIPQFNIPVQVIRLTVNQRDTIIKPFYKLAYTQQNVQVQFAAIELSGHFKNLQYRLDKNENWTKLNENTLTVQLNSGNHLLMVRAVDVNGNISNKILTLKFNIATPFWKAIWFWVGIALVAQVIIIYLVNRRQKKRKEDKLAKEIAGVQTAALEQQAFTSLMNPHFMFNALNSIQHYINLSDRRNTNRYLSDFASLIRKNFEAAQQSFIPLEQEIENIKIYLRLEQMRFDDRFVNKVNVDENLDVEEWVVPTMILQPLLENALLHGIMPSAIDGMVTIEFTECDGNLIITITDNGIGVANSIALKDTGTHKSRGMELIKKRIAALSRFGKQPITISISPAFESESNPGNKIVLLIPSQLHQAWVKAQR